MLSEDLPLDVRIFNLVASLGFGTALGATIFRIIEGVPFIAIATMLMMMLSIVVALYVINKPCSEKTFRVVVILILVGLSDFLFPIVFFTNGGMYSGMASYFSLTLFLIFLLTKGKTRVVLLVTHIPLVIACYFVAYLNPSFMYKLSEYQQILDNLQSFLLVGLFIGLVIVFQNVILERERRKVELSNRDLRVAREEAVKSSEAKSEFLSNMSHEMRTPMNAIIGMSKIGHMRETLDEKNVAFEKIDGASKHLLGIINDVLDMSKIESGKFELSIADFKILEIIARVLNVSTFGAINKHQTLMVNIDPNLPRFLIGDDQRLSQVMANILSNAIKFTPENGIISLRVQPEKLIGLENLDETSRQIALRFDINDSGIGISEETQKNLFASFQQADNTISRKYGGTGLGLAISKRIVEMMGGNIWVESVLGEGSTFSFTVLLEADSKKQIVGEIGDIVLIGTSQDFLDSIDNFKQSKRLTHTHGNEDVLVTGFESLSDEDLDLSAFWLLIAEDIDINREIVASLLEPTGINIEFAENGKEALEIFNANQNKFALILMDLQMPEMDGLEATRQIRSIGSEKAANIPIIAMTANVFAEDVQRSLDAGMNDHIGKPIDMNLLFEKLKHYLEQSS